MSYELDLDALAPKPHKIKLGGEIIDVNPPKFKTLVKLMQLSDQLSKVNTEDSAKIAELFSGFNEALIPIVPKLKEDDVDLSVEQTMALVEFVMTISTNEKKEVPNAEPTE